ncbi:Elicitor-responsive protein 3 [Vitis vinifera]|uniref:Elicitor-responsive protein 3 n=1 Tax=Vitis vinifera TaxID=29760 RepID=A0A438JJA3_VITVI|nr:Elicitor-responsive protein 3 [Vitis vinifera]
MPQGTLEVLLVSAKGLENTDFLCFDSEREFLALGFDLGLVTWILMSFSLAALRSRKSSVASGKGSDPEWNEHFVFTISEGISELTIKIMDSDSGSGDDFVGEASIPLEALFTEGSLEPAPYNVVKDQEYCGEIRVGLTFTQKNVMGSPVRRREAMVDGKSLLIEYEAVLLNLCFICYNQVFSHTRNFELNGSVNNNIVLMDNQMVVISCLLTSVPSSKELGYITDWNNGKYWLCSRSKPEWRSGTLRLKLAYLVKSVVVVGCTQLGSLGHEC